MDIDRTENAIRQDQAAEAHPHVCENWYEVAGQQYRLIIEQIESEITKIKQGNAGAGKKPLPAW